MQQNQDRSTLSVVLLGLRQPYNEVLLVLITWQANQLLKKKLKLLRTLKAFLIQKKGHTSCVIFFFFCGFALIKPSCSRWSRIYLTVPLAHSIEISYSFYAFFVVVLQIIFLFSWFFNLYLLICCGIYGFICVLVASLS